MQDEMAIPSIPWESSRWNVVRQEFRISRFGLEACIFFSQSDVMVEILQVLGVCGQTAQNWQVAESKSQSSGQATFLILLVPLIPHFSSSRCRRWGWLKKQPWGQAADFDRFLCVWDCLSVAAQGNSRQRSRDGQSSQKDNWGGWVQSCIQQSSWGGQAKVLVKRWKRPSYFETKSAKVTSQYVLMEPFI